MVRLDRKDGHPQTQPDQRILGLGDVVSAVTKSLGIKECGGCAKRREALNKLVPFKNENPGAPAQHPAGDAPGEKSDG